MEKVQTILTFIITAIGTLAGSYAVVKLGIYGIAHMNKDPQKIAAAREGMTNTVIGLLITIAAAAIIAYIQTA